MASNTSIEWTDQTWNPTTGCDRISDGCTNCYALTMAKRLKGMGQSKYQKDGDPRTSGPGFGITMHPDALAEPWHWKKPRRVFVNSMSDLFHPGVTDEFIARVWAVMALTPQHTYQILTKRHGRMRSLLNREDFADLIRSEMVDEVGAYTMLARSGSWQLPLRNVWLGVSVEDQKRADLRIPALIDTPAAVRFLSCEPLLGPVDLAGPTVPGRGRPKLTYWLTGRPTPGPERITSTGLTMHSPAIVTGPRIDWVITGAESGHGARPAHPDWFRTIRDQCTTAGVAYLHKQNGEWVERAALTGDQRAEVSIWNEKRVTYVHPTDGRTQSHGDWSVNDHLEGWACVQRVGKKAAGRELDGRIWDEFPEPR